jgi:hypothetical protein
LKSILEVIAKRDFTPLKIRRLNKQINHPTDMKGIDELMQKECNGKDLINEFEVVKMKGLPLFKVDIGSS